MNSILEFDVRGALGVRLGDVVDFDTVRVTWRGASVLVFLEGWEERWRFGSEVAELIGESARQVHSCRTSSDIRTGFTTHISRSEAPDILAWSPEALDVLVDFRAALGARVDNSINGRQTWYGTQADSLETVLSEEGSSTSRDERIRQIREHRGWSRVDPTEEHLGAARSVLLVVNSGTSFQLSHTDVERVNCSGGWFFVLLGADLVDD
jgi:hypothetical protein